ncbi:MAG: endonuclease/exonuclease/phosphatase family protein [Actinomycetota bacterium]
MFHRRKGTVPGAALLWLCTGVVVAIAFLGRRVDGSADELIGGDAPVLLVVGWLVVALLLGATITRRIERYTRIAAGPGLTLAYDMLTVLLVASWPICVLAFVTRHWLLGVLTAVAVLEHVLAVLPPMPRGRRPRWADTAPTLELVTANVFVHNRTPERAAQQLVECDADIVIINESTAHFVECFDRAGGLSVYPHRITDPTDTSEYAITVASRLPFAPGSGMRDVGPLRAAVVVVSVASRQLHLVATHLAASLELGGLAKWRKQIEVLRTLIPTLDTPLLIAGDMNMTSRRPEFSKLLSLGLSDAVADVGSPRVGSLKMAASGLLGWIGPITRVDYVFTDAGCVPLSARNLRAFGSDHLPLKIRLAIRWDDTSGSSSR